MDNTGKVYMLMNEAELQDWVQCRLDGGVKYSFEKVDLGGITRTIKLMDVNNKTFDLDWKLMPKTEYVEREVLPKLHAELVRMTAILEDKYGCSGVLLAAKLPHVNIEHEIENGYVMYYEGIEPRDFVAMQYQYQDLFDGTLKSSEMVGMETVTFDL